MARAPRKNSILNVRLTEQQKARLEYHAKKRAVTPSELARKGVSVLVDYLDKQETK